MSKELSRIISVARGLEKADLVIRNARIFHVTTGDVEEGDIAIADGRIAGIAKGYSGRREIEAGGRLAVPGFIDAHVHLESSNVLPGEYEKAVLAHGVTTAVCDPHELSNVVGLAAYDYFRSCAEKMHMSLIVRLSSCVPATSLETSGATIGAEELLKARQEHPEAVLAELMNVPGVLFQDPEILKKIAAFDFIDGHAPLFSGKDLNAYIAAGVRNDHECSNVEEVLEKVRRGMNVLIREGSVARNLDQLIPAITNDTSSFLSFCTDDKKLSEIIHDGTIDAMIRRVIASGVSPLAAYRIASWSAAQGLGLTDRGLLAPGKRADIVILDDLENCSIHQVFAAGQLVEPALFAGEQVPVPDNFRKTVKCRKFTRADFEFKRDVALPVIGVQTGSLITDKLNLPEGTEDVLPIAVLERHGKNGNIGRGFVHGFRLQRGAIASSVGHDSHNICVVGAEAGDMALAVNAIIENQGGYAVACDGRLLATLALPVGGLMSEKAPADFLVEQENLEAAASGLGTQMSAPFMMLAFIALPVIPHLKLTDRGLVDVDEFKLI